MAGPLPTESLVVHRGRPESPDWGLVPSADARQVLAGALRFVSGWFM